MLLFVGLGNPTQKYINTRHNIGFEVIDFLVNEFKASSITKEKFHGQLFKCNNCLYLKPLTYMNLSGESVFAVSEYFKPDNIIVVHDDIAIPLGSVRIKRGGSSGGHNGLKSIDSYIGADYIRVRLGVGTPKQYEDVSSFVLDKFSKEESDCVSKLITYGASILKDFEKFGIDDIVAKYTSKKGICND